MYVEELLKHISSFFGYKEARALVKQKRAFGIVQENVGSSTWKGVLGGIISRVMLCQHVQKSSSSALGLMESFWLALFGYHIVYFPFLLDLFVSF